MSRLVNLYRLTQNDVTGFDTYSNVIVAAYTVGQAAHIRPDGRLWGEERDFPEWTDHPENVKVELIGQAADHIKDGDILCSSYHAG